MLFKTFRADIINQLKTLWIIRFFIDKFKISFGCKGFMAVLAPFQGKSGSHLFPCENFSLVTLIFYFYGARRADMGTGTASNTIFRQSLKICCYFPGWPSVDKTQGMDTYFVPTDPYTAPT
jgi:hypothetical protein